MTYIVSSGALNSTHSLTLSVVLTRLFRLILLSGYVPQGLIISYIVTIPEPKEFMSKSLSYDDFRGIAISPIISKNIEYCFFGQIRVTTLLIR